MMAVFTLFTSTGIQFWLRNYAKLIFWGCFKTRTLSKYQSIDSIQLFMVVFVGVQNTKLRTKHQKKSGATVSMNLKSHILSYTQQLCRLACSLQAFFVCTFMVDLFIHIYLLYMFASTFKDVVNFAVVFNIHMAVVSQYHFRVRLHELRIGIV